ncbi:MAG TPA: hypothetical protein VIJ36_04175 [Thermoanaerobaculia bacterium]
MATSTLAVSKAPAPALTLVDANYFDLRRGKSEIIFTTHLGGRPMLTYNDGRTTHSFSGAEVSLRATELGTLVTVTLAATPDLEVRLLTVVLPQVRVSGAPEKLDVPVIFTRIAMSIAGPPLNPGPVETYDVKIYDGTASAVP